MSNAKIFNQDVAYSFYTNEKYAEDLLYHTGYSLFYIYREGHYEKLTQEDFRKEVITFIRKNFPRQNWTINSVKDIVSWVEHECLRQTDEEDRYYIAFRDCLYNTKTFQVEPFDREKIVTYSLPFFYKDIEMETPNFNRFLETSLVKQKTFEPDKKLILVAQEMFGSIFIDNLKASKAFFLYGESGQNGKSTFTNLIRDVVGKEFCSPLSLSDLSKTFGLSPLIGKKVNIADELDDKFGSSKMFKQLVTGEPVGDQHKYGQHFTLSNRAKFIYSTNVMPTFDGLDGGLRRRVMIIPFYREFKNSDVDKDFDLPDKLRAEIPGIVKWALEGAKRLVESSYRFTECKATDKMMEEFEDEASSSLRFFRDNYIIDNTDTENKKWFPIQKIYDDYLSWNMREGSKKPAGKKRFIKDIRGIWSSIDTIVYRYRDDYEYAAGKPVQCINVYRKPELDDIEEQVMTVEEAAEQGVIFQ